MRTVIFLGFVMISDAIKLLGNIEKPMDSNVLQFSAIILVVAMVMDVFEFFVNLSKD